MRFEDLEVGDKFSLRGDYYIKTKTILFMGEFIVNNTNVIQLQGKNKGYHCFCNPETEVERITFTGVHAYEDSSTITG
jgi:hypothetical protein